MSKGTDLYISLVVKLWFAVDHAMKRAAKLNKVSNYVCLD